MLKLFKRISRPARPQPAVPTGTRWYAIGDIHGRLDLFEDLLGRIIEDDGARDPARTRIVLLGDVVDRGSQSAQLIDRLINLQQSRPDTIFLMGNHDAVFLDVLKGRREAAQFFARHGGRETAISYGIAPDDYEAMSYEDLSDAMAARVPETHERFMGSFQSVAEAGDYLFVHAGIRPGVPLDEQKPADLQWIRQPFLDHDGELDHLVVHGHTVTDEPDIRMHRIGIDTGAYRSGRLTALGLEAADRWFLSTGNDVAGRMTEDTDILPY